MGHGFTLNLMSIVEEETIWYGEVLFSYEKEGNQQYVCENVGKGRLAPPFPPSHKYNIGKLQRIWFDVKFHFTCAVVVGIYNKLN